MISVDEARAILAANQLTVKILSEPLENCVGKVLQETIYADRDFPPYNRVTMDGIAILYETYAYGNSTFKVEGVAAAGNPQISLGNHLACLEVMTGAIMPSGADTVIPYEDVILQDGVASLNQKSPKKGQNIHFKGIDNKKGSALLKKGTLLRPAEIGVCASVGKTQLKVSKAPNIVVISTGDELVGLDKKPEAHQIRRSNIYNLKAGLKKLGINANDLHMQDDKEAISLQIKELLKAYDVIILSGGVSRGKFDFVPEALENQGVEKLFHKIRQRPGKPMWFGKHPKGNKIFALPGNPVSSFLCFQIYVVPWLKLSMGLTEDPEKFALLLENINFMPDLTYFAQVKTTQNQSGIIEAMPNEGGGSGDFTNLIYADAFLELPPGQNVYKKGKTFRLHEFI